jgi:hypothetical protein
LCNIARDQGPEPKTVKLHVCWQGGATETLNFSCLQTAPRRSAYSEVFVARIRELTINHHDDYIIRLLYAEGHKSSTGNPLTLSVIKWQRYKHRIPAPRPPGNTLDVRQIRDRYGVSLWVVHYWIG